jgi:cytochrome c5
MKNRAKWVVVLSAIIATLLACNREERLEPAFSTAGGQAGETAQQDIRESHLLLKQVQEGTLAAIKMGKEVYEANCAVCHATGREGAPKVGDQAAWRERVAQDTEHLVQSVVNGIGSMPAKGGNPALTEERIRATVNYLVEQNR